MARSRYSFVAAATGLLSVLLMIGFAVRAGLAGQGYEHVQDRFPAPWILGGPALVAAANLSRLIRARNRIGEPKTLSPEPAGVIPRPHLPLAAGHRPVMLVPYRQPQVTRPSPVSFLTRGAPACPVRLAFEPSARGVTPHLSRMIQIECVRGQSPRRGTASHPLCSVPRRRLRLVGDGGRAGYGPDAAGGPDRLGRRVLGPCLGGRKMGSSPPAVPPRILGRAVPGQRRLGGDGV